MATLGNVRTGVISAALALALSSGCDGRIMMGPSTEPSPSVSDPAAPPPPPSMDPATPWSPSTPPPSSEPNTPPVDPCASIPVNTVAASTPRMHRLSPEQYTNTVKDVLALSSVTVVIDQPVSEAISDVEVRKLQTAASQLVALKKHYSYLPSTCPIAGPQDAACAKKFIDAFGRLLYRRALEPDEQATLYAKYDEIRLATDVSPAWSFQESIDMVAEIMLQAGPFVYLQERGVADATLPSGTNRLTGYERATRLSYFLWNTTPDTTLLDAAAAGTLDTSAGMRAQVERLLASPRARLAVNRFAQFWMGLDATVRLPSLEAVPKNATKFPDDSPALRTAMRQETGAFYEKVFFGTGSDFRQVFTATDAYVNSDLAKLYGVAGGPTSASTWAWVNLDTSKRAGILSRAAFTTHLANADFQSPINRGVHVFRNVLCGSLADPPANVDNTPPMNTAGSGPKTVRELTELKTAGASCQGCHSTINSLGFTFENYDALGHHQLQEKGTLNGTPYALDVNSTATVKAADLSGVINGATGLGTALAQSAAAHDCQVAKWFERSYERKPSLEDMCAIRDLRAAFQSTHDLKAMLISLASTGPALYVKALGP